MNFAAILALMGEQYEELVARRQENDALASENRQLKAELAARRAEDEAEDTPDGADAVT